MQMFTVCQLHKNLTISLLVHSLLIHPEEPVHQTYRRLLKQTHKEYLEELAKTL